MESSKKLVNAGSKGLVKLFPRPTLTGRLNEFYIYCVNNMWQVRHKSVVEHLINSGMYVPQGD